MGLPRYTIVIEDRLLPAVRSFLASHRGPILAGLLAFGLPAMAALHVSSAASADLVAVRAENERLRAQNAGFAAMAETLATRITELNGALDELDELTDVDPDVERAMLRLPASVRRQAFGGSAVLPATRTTELGSASETLDTLQVLLGALETRLAGVAEGYKAQQALAKATPTVWPVTGWLSSGYGDRTDPFTGTADFHTGIDISGNRGAPVRAPADGRVERAGPNGGYGMSVLIAHGFGLASRFGHLSRLTVHAGQRVRRGDVIGFVGATGRATSSHLHFEVLVNRASINPLRILARP